MNCKTILATKTILFSGTVLRITLFICFIGACSLAHAATVTFSGQLDVIKEDRGGAIYSSVALGTDFSGAISDVDFNGFITDGTTRTSFSCCIGQAVGLDVTNNEPLSAEDAADINSLAGTSFVAGDLLDFIILEGDALTAGGGSILISIIWVFNGDVFADNSLDNYRNGFDPDDVVVTVFTIEEENSQGATIYEALGVIDNMTITPDGFVINPGLNGSWFNPATPGQGFFLDVLPDIPLVFMAWFTYDTSQPAPAQALEADHPLAKTLAAQVGDENHRWLTAQGPFNGDTANLSVFLTTGGLFDDSNPVSNTPEGTITLTFKDCTACTVDYDFTAAGVSVSVPISRLANDNVPLCESFQSNGSALQLVSPYVNEADMVYISSGFNSDKFLGPWGYVHDGFDIHPNRNVDLKPFQAVCSGRVLQIISGSEDVHVLMACNSTYTVEYTFETQSPQAGQIQLGNIMVIEGQEVYQGDIIGYLHAPVDYAHVHFAFFKNWITSCPESYFDPGARISMLNLLHETYPNADLCYGGDVTPLPLVTPYVNESEMTEINAGFSSDNSISPWGFEHDGVDIYPQQGDPKPFQASCSGIVDSVELEQATPGSNWQVKVLIQCDDYVDDPDDGGYFTPFAVGYVFEPMSSIQQDGQTQLSNIMVSENQAVSQGDIIGHLYAPNVNAHVHFGLVQFGSSFFAALGASSIPLCPEPHFSAEGKDSILNLLHVVWPSADMCYQN